MIILIILILVRIGDLESELLDANTMKDAIEANWESSMHDLNETRNNAGNHNTTNNNMTTTHIHIKEIERVEFLKLKVAYNDLLDLKNAVEARGNVYEATCASMTTQLHELQQLQLQRDISNNAAENDNTFTTSYIDNSKPNNINGFEEFIKLKKENRILKLQIASLTENTNVKGSRSSRR